MPKRPADEDSDFELVESEHSEEDDVVLVEDSDFEEKPKKKRAPAKKKAAVGDADDKPKKKPAAKKKADDGFVATKFGTEPETDPITGWTIHPPSLLYKINPDAKGSTKIAAFDLDGTLVRTRSGAQFAVNSDDWMFLSPEVPKVLRKYHDDGYQVVIFSNQGGIRSALGGKGAHNFRGKVDKFMNAVRDEVGDVPMHVFAATSKDAYRKPDTGMWKLFVDRFNNGIQPELATSLFCGDDVEGSSSSDSGFASNVGVAFKKPEQLFGEAGPVAGPKAANPQNQGLVDIFYRLADGLKKAGDNPFKVNAFKKAAAALADFPSHITDSNDVKKLPGVGKSSLEKVKEFLTTGTLAVVAQLEAGMAAQPAIHDAQAQEALRFLDF